MITEDKLVVVVVGHLNGGAPAQPAQVSEGRGVSRGLGRAGLLELIRNNLYLDLWPTLHTHYTLYTVLSTWSTHNI